MMPDSNKSPTIFNTALIIRFAFIVSNEPSISAKLWDSMRFFVLVHCIHEWSVTEYLPHHWYCYCIKCSPWIIQYLAISRHNSHLISILYLFCPTISTAEMKSNRRRLISSNAFSVQKSLCCCNVMILFSTCHIINMYSEPALHKMSVCIQTY